VNRSRLLLAILGAFLLGLSTLAPAQGLSIRSSGVIADRLTAPWGMAFLPDGSALVTERDSAEIKRIRPNGRTTTVGRVRGVAHGGEGGLLGIAIPTGPNPKNIYVYATTGRDNRVIRIGWDGSKLGRQQPIFTGIPKSSIHNGGRLLLGPNDTMFIATGDAANPELSQNRRSLAGKILRITLDGKAAPGNPFGQSPVYSMGHRNVQGLALDRAGRLWASEFGAREVDELNLIRPGGNYGWPKYEGAGNDPAFIDPAVEWSPTSTASPSGITVLGNNAYVASLRGRVLWRVPLRGGTAGNPVAVDLGNLGRLRDVQVAPDGSLWLMTNNTDGRGSPGPRDDRILRLVVRN
jgi:glucose/arabinose dehydrogenase